MISGLVSVVICAYNNWPDVELTIASALNQSYRPLEVIVVDNSSTDQTPQEVPTRFGSRLHYLHQPNRGDSGAYNTGFEVAQGEFVQFVDGDDVLAPNKIEKQMEVFRTDPSLDIVYGDIRTFQTLAGPANWKDVGTQPEDDMLHALLVPEKHGAGISALGALFHRRALERLGPWDETLYSSDTDYWLRAAWATCRFGHCPGSPTGFSRVRPGQMSANVFALTRGLEAVWDKALGYVTREPYRGLIAAGLAETKFHLAVSRYQMTRREALAKLASARAISPQRVSAPAYAAACAAIVVPGGTALVRSKRLRPIRRVLARMLHYRRPQTFRDESRSSDVETTRGRERSEETR
jgi:glycosyltransferase involved in cell wall biosynthesis